jgi:hypothetical protein
MSTNKTINISSKNVYGNCDLKCSYNFKYNNSNLVAKNNGVFLSFTLDKGSVSPVTYNNNNYNVSNLSIYSPSIHIFNDNTTNAEIVIEHIPVLGGDKLYVCIPIISSTNTSDASYWMNILIQNTITNAPRLNETTNLNVNNFNLNSVVPKKPYYSYTGNNGLVGNVIIYDYNYAIPLNKTILDSLSKIIKPYSITVSGDEVFYNSKGPNVKTEDGIYISCQPTGSSEEEQELTYEKNTSFDIFSDSNGSLLIQIILGFILCILIFMILNFAYNYFFNKSPGVSDKN